MIPETYYRFMVTAVGPDGRIGGAVLSEWGEALKLDKPLYPPCNNFFTLYSSHCMNHNLSYSQFL